jgi:transcription elongation GreA/GreB family factor
MRAADSGRPIITAEQERALRTELDRLQRRLDVEFAERLRDARMYGSADGNDDYLQIKEEEAVVAAAITRTSSLLERALVLDESELEAGAVTLGSMIEFRDLPSGRTQTVRLVGGHEPLTPGVVTAGSRVGRALAGRRPGELVEVTLADSTVRRLEIISVEG